MRAVVLDNNGDTVDFAYFDEVAGRIVLNPTQSTVPDTYNLVVRYYMEDYEERWVNQPFIAIVNVCQTTISSNGAGLIDRTTGWGDEFIMIETDAALSLFTMQPDCGYSLDVKPMLRNGPDSYAELPVPLSLSYNSDHELIIGKCSTTTMEMDDDCKYEPYEIIYDIVFMVTANNMPSTMNMDLEVRVEIGNSCLADTVAIQNMILDGQALSNTENPEIVYIINQDAQTITIAPSLNQDYSFCPVTASLTELTASGIDPTSISFDPYTGGFTVGTGNRAMHNVITTWRLDISPTYNVGAGATQMIFTVTFFDDCYNAVVAPAWSAGADVALYVATDILYTSPTVNMNCGMITNSLTLLNSDSDNPSFSLIPDNKINILGNSVNHLGEHFLRIKSCITVYD